MSLGRSGSRRCDQPGLVEEDHDCCCRSPRRGRAHGYCSIAEALSLRDHIVRQLETLLRLCVLFVPEVGDPLPARPGRDRTSRRTLGHAVRARNIIVDLGERTATIRFLIRNRAGRFAASFDAVVAGTGIEVLKIPPRWLPAKCFANASC